MSYLYKEFSIASFAEFINAVEQKESKRSTPCVFAKLEQDDLIWTRDLDGNYYLCQVIGTPNYYSNENDRLRLDIGATINVELLKVGLSVPGKIVSRFYSTNGIQPALQSIKDHSMVEYSKHLYNQLTGLQYYTLNQIRYDIFEMLDAWDLEELVIDYLQIKYDYYLSKNSITKQDSTIKIECELYPRNNQTQRTAVVQVKVKRDVSQSCDYYDAYYFEDNKDVFLFYADEDYRGYKKEICTISKKELEDFMKEYIAVLPNSIKKWVSLCGLL